jgi:rod shape-determining protein MreD
MSGPSAPLNPWSWLVAPALIAIAASVVLATPVRLFGLRPPEPVFGMALAFAWPIIRPSLLGPFVLLFMGLFLDLFWHNPLGLWASALLLVYGGALALRNLMAGQDGRVLWAWYGALVGAGFGFVWLYLAALGATPGLVRVLVDAVLTIALFPVSLHLIERFEDADIRFR